MRGEQGRLVGKVLRRARWCLPLVWGWHRAQLRACSGLGPQPAGAVA